MYPPFYEVCAADATILALLGNPPRIYPFDEAPQNTPTPYVVWQEISGSPQNYLAGRPDIDDYRLQIDVYGKDVVLVRNIRDALFRAIELECHVVGFNGEFKDKDTRDYRSSFDVRWFVEREEQT